MAAPRHHFSRPKREGQASENGMEAEHILDVINVGIDEGLFSAKSMASCSAVASERHRNLLYAAWQGFVIL
jgi:hypothetical protein